MKSNFFVDIHCHPSIKSFARSFINERHTQNPDPKSKSSIWYRDAPSLFDKGKNFVAGLTNFIQSDATSLIKGRVSVVCLSFYPQEKGFFENKLGSGLLSDTLTKLATEFGQPRIDHIQEMESYWEDLKEEMLFVKQGVGNKVNVDGVDVQYQIANTYQDIENADRNGTLGESIIIFVPTIEGGHVFDQMMDQTRPWNSLEGEISADRLELTLDRIGQLREGKEGLLRPVFITLTHHFWNGICGQAKSLGGLVKCAIDQSNGLQSGMTSAGKKIIHALLDERRSEEGNEIRPILIDIKHMNRKSRLEYFDLLKTYTGRRIPIIVSHGGVTGLSAPGGSNKTSVAQEGVFITDDINFYDDEILEVESSGGIFGIQLDERRIGSKSALREARGHLLRRKILFSWAGLVWNQIRHMAELLDLNGRFAWGIQSLGTDFDGIIDPINGYWTAKELDNLDDFLLMHAFNYLKEVKNPSTLKQQRNRSISAEEVVERVMTSNALNFLSIALT
ncbi:MAG: peptidase M19 [Flavobacterium sp.]|nr:MAG: peptidase M19 [Flavobacterium sp.]